MMIDIFLLMIGKLFLTQQAGVNVAFIPIILLALENELIWLMIFYAWFSPAFCNFLKEVFSGQLCLWFNTRFLIILYKLIIF